MAQKFMQKLLLKIWKVTVHVRGSIVRDSTVSYRKLTNLPETLPYTHLPLLKHVKYLRC